jgi:hypothetical protein
MKTRSIIIMGAVLVTPLFTLGNVSAHQTDEEHKHPIADTRKQIAQVTEETKRELTAEEKTALQERLAKRKTELKIRVTTTEKQRLATRCKNATGPISSLRGRIKGIETSRAQVYDNLVDRLTSLSTKLEARGLNTDELNQQIETLQEKITTFQTDLATYKQIVADLGDMDCAADPEAFKASLEAARSALAKVKLDGTDIRTYVSDTIKPTLKTIREAISAQEESESEGEE